MFIGAQNCVRRLRAYNNSTRYAHFLNRIIIIAYAYSVHKTKVSDFRSGTCEPLSVSQLYSSSSAVSSSLLVGIHCMRGQLCVSQQLAVKITFLLIFGLQVRAWSGRRLPSKWSAGIRRHSSFRRCAATTHLSWDCSLYTGERQYI